MTTETEIRKRLIDVPLLERQLRAIIEQQAPGISMQAGIGELVATTILHLRNGVASELARIDRDRGTPR